MRPRIGSLFSGYGGLDLALDDVLDDPELAWVAENDPTPSAVLAKRFPGVPNLGDVTALDWQLVEPVDVLTGGTPCQDVSHAGKRVGMLAGTRSNLWVAMREAIAVLRPRLVVWENVRGVLSADAESSLELCPRCMGARWADQPRMRALGRVLGDLAELGYDAAWNGVRASDVGAPHVRFRVFLVAWPEDDPPRWAGPDLRVRRGTVRPVGEPVLGTPASSIYRGSGGPGSASHTARLDRKYLDAQIEQLAADEVDVEIDEDPELLPTPVVNDMGDGKTVEWWDEWAPRQLSSAGRIAKHGRSLAVESLRLLPTPTDSDGTGGPGGHRGGGPNLRTVVARDPFGKYAPAVHRWESLTRPAPPMTQPGRTGPVLSPRFAEWMMGLPDGWVTDVELELRRPTPGQLRKAQLRALGNGVVPQQAAAAISELLAIVIALAERN